MHYDFEPVDLAASREEIIQFFWDQRHWPWETQQEYADAWDWRYTSLSDGKSWVWVARESGSGRIVGHIAVHLRRFRAGGVDLRVGVPGNLLVEPSCRGTLVGPRLVSLPRTLVKSGELDAIIAFANPNAHGMFSRLGFRDFGLMHPYMQVRSWESVLRRRARIAAPLGLLFDKARKLSRRLTSPGSVSSGRKLSVRELTPEEFQSYDRSHWHQLPEHLDSADSDDFVIRRYLRCPYARRRLIGIVDQARGRLEGFVISGGEQRVRIWDCQVNSEACDQGWAIDTAAEKIPHLETLSVPLLPGSSLARSLSRRGFRRREPDDYMSQSTRVSAFWLDTHPAALALAQVERWNLWFGANHY